MKSIVKFREEDTRGALLDEAAIPIAQPMITARDVVREYVLYQVAGSGKKKTPRWSGATTGGATWQSAAERALEGFARNQFVMLVNGRQVTSLDEQLPVSGDTEVCFLRLVPLVGG